ALTIPAAFSLASNVDVANLSSLTITNTTIPAIGSIADNTTVTYNAAGNQNVQDGTYFNLTLGGSGTKTLLTTTGAASTVNNVLTIGSGIQFTNSGNNVYVYGATTGITNNGTATGTGRYVYSMLDVSTNIAGTGTYSNLEADFSTTSANRTLTLSAATTITGYLFLTDGTFANGTNLTMASGSSIQLIDGVLGSTITGSTGYDVIYDVPGSGTSKTTANELSGSVRNLTVQTGTGFTINLNKNLVLSGNLAINSGTLDPTTSNWAITMGGNYSNGGSFTTRSSVITFNGSSAQTISGSASQSFYDLVINNSSGGVQLNTPVSLTHGLTLTSGLLTTSTINSLTLPNAVVMTGGSTTSYINGPLIHTVSALTGSRVFPIGKNGVYRPVTLNLTQNASTATTYTGEVFAGAPPTRSLPSGIVSVSTTRYYTISCSNNGNVSSATVVLNYGPDENTVDNTILRIAKSNGPATWLNIGGIGSAPTAGTITSNSFNSFSDFVLSYSSVPLPLHWLSFTGSEKNSKIILDWQTSDESGCTNFSIERSLNHVDWEEIAQVSCKNGQLNSYSFTDNLLSQQTFYRIKLVNRDGSFSYSTILTIRTSTQAGIRILQNPVSKNGQLTCLIDNAALIAAANWNVSIVDYQGRTMLSEKRNAESKLNVSTSRLSAGTYLLIIQAGPLLTRKEFIVE
ncbi:MAG: beta strand repeat-containing protein, partial [Flavisolibacter sp.]